YGAAAALLMWLASSWFILRPWLALWNETLPLWWPGLFAVMCLAWFQALLWLPFGLPWLRIALLAALVPCLNLLGVFGAHSGLPEGALASLFAGLAAVGWAVGYAGVRQARRGDVPNWEGILWPLHQLARW